ncbi:MAG TPA: hypothetical protein VFB22_12130 [Candidatus Baltobacteraceae bacterium]|nr:hypothetical protein [Candidatus Baltobacteraceae bacterium]
MAGCGTSGTYTPPPVPTPSPGPDRLSAAGTTAVYNGTYAETDTAEAISSSPVSTVQNGTVTVNIVTSNDSSGNTVYTSNETDALTQRTLTSTTKATVAFQPQGSGETAVRTLNTSETDSTGASFTTTYGANNGLQTIIPEYSESFSNDAAEVYTETDPGVNVGANGSTVTTTRNVNADGSYAETVAMTIQPNPNSNMMASDYSAREEILLYGGGYEFSAPTSGNITYGFYPSTTTFSPTLSATPQFTASFPSWIPSSQTKPTMESDTITTGASLDGRCPNQGPFPYAPSLVKQVVTSVDSALGTLETRTTQTFDVAGAGSVCVAVDDSITSYYDYSGQYGPYLLVYSSNAKPLLNTTISEVIGLKSLNGSTTLAKARSAESLKGAAALPALMPRSIVVTGFEERVHQAVLRRLNAARAAKGGSK